MKTIIMVLTFLWLAAPALLPVNSSSECAPSRRSLAPFSHLRFRYSAEFIGELARPMVSRDKQGDPHALICKPAASENTLRGDEIAHFQDEKA